MKKKAEVKIQEILIEISIIQLRIINKTAWRRLMRNARQFVGNGKRDHVIIRKQGFGKFVMNS